MQQATEGRGADFLLMHRNCAPAVEHLADLERRACMGQWVRAKTSQAEAILRT
jgi:hypothetical protein